MNRIPALARRYPIVAVTVLVGLVVVGLLLSDHATAAQLLASAFALVIALQTSIRMIKDLLRGHWGVDVLAVMAIVSTVAVGEYLAALVIVLMLSGGEALEDYAAGRAKRELTALLARAPQVAHLMQVDTDDISDVPVTHVRPGDRLLVRPSEVVPVDGELLSPEASLDESSLTGESLPVTRRTGDALLSGSLNGGVAIVIRATARVEDSQYQRIVALVEEASRSRAPLVRLADRYAVPFTIVSLLIAGIAWWVSGDPVRFAEVLVLATPCPLLIAAPVAFMGGMSRAARDGIIVKGGGTLEQLARIRTVAFDKTGTLTYGQPALDAVEPGPTAHRRRAAGAGCFGRAVLLARSSGIGAGCRRGTRSEPAESGDGTGARHPWCARGAPGGDRSGWQTQVCKRERNRSRTSYAAQRPARHLCLGSRQIRRHNRYVGPATRQRRCHRGQTQKPWCQRVDDPDW